MTVFVYIDANKAVGDPDHIKIFANAEARQLGSRKTTLKAWRLSTGFWGKRERSHSSE